MATKMSKKTETIWNEICNMVKTARSMTRDQWCEKYGYTGKFEFLGDEAYYNHYYGTLKNMFYDGRSLKALERRGFIHFWYADNGDGFDVVVKAEIF